MCTQVLAPSTTGEAETQPEPVFEGPDAAGMLATIPEDSSDDDDTSDSKSDFDEARKMGSVLLGLSFGSTTAQQKRSMDTLRVSETLKLLPACMCARCCVAAGCAQPQHSTGLHIMVLWVLALVAVCQLSVHGVHTWLSIHAVCLQDGCKELQERYVRLKTERLAEFDTAQRACDQSVAAHTEVR
jgi:hypothetical protein